MRGSETMFTLLLFVASLTQTLGFKWPIDSVYQYGKGKFTFSELYMYANDDAPFDVNDHTSSIDVLLDVTFSIPKNINTSVMIAIFHVDDELIDDPVDVSEISQSLTKLATDSEICQNMISSNYANHIEIKSFTTEHNKLSNLGINAPITPNYELNTLIQTNYKVSISGLHSIIIEICDTNKQEGIIDATVSIKGEISFLNPYGYLSGIYYGYLPFEGFRAGIFSAFTLLYLILLYKYRSKLLNTHWYILIVVLLCTIEACVWFIAYSLMNVSGEPYCCPFPTGIAIAMFFQVFRRTLSRTLLLTICLGYGLARESLHKQEKCLMCVLSLCYLSASLALSIDEVVEINDLHHEAEHNVWWDVPVLIFDIFFLMWIYIALIDTMSDLKASGQTMKLEMYNKLGVVMAVFITLVSILTLVMALAKFGLFPWPWRLYWCQTVLWEILNLGVLVSVSILWAPSERAQLLAHSIQITTNEYNEEDDENNDIESDHKHNEEEEEEDGEDEEDDDAFRETRSPSPRSKQFQKHNISPFSDYEEEETGDFSMDACVMTGDGLEMRSTTQGRAEDGDEDEDDYNVLPTVAG